MEIIIGIVLAVALIIGAVYWYIESKISQAKELVGTAVDGAKLAKSAYDSYNDKKKKS